MWTEMCLSASTVSVCCPGDKILGWLAQAGLPPATPPAPAIRNAFQFFHQLCCSVPLTVMSWCRIPFLLHIISSIILTEKLLPGLSEMPLHCSPNNLFSPLRTFLRVMFTAVWLFICLCWYRKKTWFYGMNKLIRNKWDNYSYPGKIVIGSGIRAS